MLAFYQQRCGNLEIHTVLSWFTIQKGKGDCVSFVRLFIYLWFLGLNEVQVPSLESLLCESLMFNLAWDSQMGAAQGIGPS